MVILASVTRSAPAQAIGQGFELERAGRYQQAAAVYFRTLRGDPTSVAALLGLERVLPSLHRLPELLPPVQRAMAASPRHAGLRALLLRTYVALNEPDSARAVALRWATDQPRDEGPYREWAIALGDARRPDEARQVFLAGRRALGRPDAFGIELGELLQRLGDWEGAAREWAAALPAAPAQLPNAARSLGDAPNEQRERIVRAILGGGKGEPAPLARRLAAELLLDWGQPEQAWTVFAPTVATPSPDAARALRRFADLASARSTNDAHRVRALALERYAEMVPEPLAGRARADAARAFLAAGERAAARGVLERVAADPSAPPEARGLAQGALVAALIDEGRLAEARERLATDERLSGDDRAALRLRLARAWVVRGDFDLADSALAGDSSVDALATAGWIALYRGRLAAAQALFRQAGPYAGERRDATERTAMLALLQQVRLDPFPELGGALLTLTRGDSVTAVQSLRRAAGRLKTGGGGGGAAHVLLLAARVAARLDSTQQRIALGLFDEIVRADENGAAAPAAELEWARLLLRRQDTAEAIAHLERLILSYPESAVVPEARRELERAKGAIPKS
jgi:tetratricopeptide (TPR) repeat protein